MYKWVRNLFKSDKGKCTTCKFGGEIYCNVGSYYASKGENRICFEGELWEERVK